MANVAQLVEPRFVVPVVVSSSLIVRPRFKISTSSEVLFLYVVQANEARTEVRLARKCFFEKALTRCGHLICNTLSKALSLFSKLTNLRLSSEKSSLKIFLSSSLIVRPRFKISTSSEVLFLYVVQANEARTEVRLARKCFLFE